jgi:glycosyltransferase involved in cell wall biosynthesis
MAKELSILYISGGPGLSPVISGGEWRMISIAERLRQRGCDVHLVTSPGGETCARQAGFGGTIHRLPASLISMREYWVGDRLWSYLLFMLNFVFRYRRLPVCDIVYSSSDYVYDTWTALLYSKWASCRWVAMNHHSFPVPWRRPGNFLLNLVSYLSQRFSYSLMRRRADMVLVLDSPAGEQILAELALSGKRSRQVANGVDLEVMERATGVEKIYDMVFAGGLRSGKGFNDMAPIIAKVKQERPDVKVAVIGGHTGRSRRLLSASLEKAGVVGQVQLLGYLDSYDYIRVLKESKVFFSTSYEEGWGIAIAEAMACCLPVVAYDLPVYRRVYADRLNLVPLADHTAFAGAVSSLLQDEDGAKQQGRENSVFVRRYDWQKIAGQEYEILKSLSREK